MVLRCHNRDAKIQQCKWQLCNSPEVGLARQLCHLPLGQMTAAVPPCPQVMGRGKTGHSQSLQGQGCTHCFPSYPFGQNLVARTHQAARKAEVNWMICMQFFLSSLLLAMFTRMESTSLPHWFWASARGICGRSDSISVLSQGLKWPLVFLFALLAQLPPYIEKSLPQVAIGPEDERQLEQP